LAGVRPAGRYLCEARDRARKGHGGILGLSFWGPAESVVRERSEILAAMDQRDELRDFLRSRRSRVRPEDVGLPRAGARRRVAGLRREEAAQLAGISADYYVRLEQGRAGHVSDSVLDAVADALRLDDDERAHLRNLVDRRVGRRTSMPTSALRASLAQAVWAIEGGPAYLVDRAMEVVAWNRLAGIVLAAVITRPAGHRNIARFVFLDEAAGSVFVDWPEIARTVTAYLRLTSGQHPNDAELARLVGELTIKSDAFRKLWSEHLVADRTHGTKRLRHPAVGTLTLDYEALRGSDANGHVLMVFTAAPGSDSDAALRLLDRWGAAQEVAAET
jgi:transcriptional regulator with XRE-family HTH domain